ncbi:MAG: hypothetical protein LCH52_05495 [Bacteroidetes bacterium]|nr:hypothetical protein [Bacteroidota bacterium]
MKRILIFTLLFFIPTIALVNAQTMKVENITGGRLITVTASVDSTDTLSTKAFGLGNFQNYDWDTYPFSFSYLLASASGKPYIRTKVEGSYDNSTWFIVDTLFADSAETFTKSTANLNKGKYPYYRFKIIGYTGNRKDATLKLWFYAYRRD